MFKSFITASSLIIEEPTLQAYINENQIDLVNIIDKAEEHVINDLQNKRIQLKRINTPLYLVSSTVSGKDEVERKKFVINISILPSDLIVTLKGCNTTTGTFVTIFDDLVITTIGEYTKFIKSPYLYYKVELSYTTGVTYESYLIETAFDLPVFNYAMYLAYKQLVVLSNDVYADKATLYLDEYKMLMESLVYSYNEVLDTDISEDEVYNKGSIICTR